MGKWNGPPHEEQYLCGAKAKHNGKPCRQFAMKNGRCYFHGGKSTGARKPHRSIKHGLRTKDMEKLDSQISKFIKNSRKVLNEIC